ncbi:MBL fold metallo-hydrolase [Methylocella silvestris]|uniref:MBL fold metallo-hydrolase n=1 Tax=Methylocella silvestris TaxID=199596 RepID=A0A2J7TC69_METSI|nr:MBL fold metallo-hydrolase [Methylocella silvestris]PNG24361.1 MBL fold metallo-hydrolase [Methylocella silvestris]
MQPSVESFFDKRTSTFSHVVHAGASTPCAIIDSVLGFDRKSGRTDTRGADEILGFVETRGLEVAWLLETHAHADHLSAVAYLRSKAGGRIAAGAEISRVRKIFNGVYNLREAYPAPAEFDHLFEDGERFAIGALQGRALSRPGHTPADLAFEVEGCGVFVGDTLFPPDVGTARCDFPGGDASALFHSIRDILDRDDTTRLYMCHDYPKDGRDPIAFCTVGEQRRSNIHIHDGVSLTEFVAMRMRRDAELDMPELLLPSIQVNIRAGRLPDQEDNGVRYLKIPIDML